MPCACMCEGIALSSFFEPLQGFVASHSSISLSRKPISWYLNYARFRAWDWRTERDEERKRWIAYEQEIDREREKVRKR